MFNSTLDDDAFLPTYPTAYLPAGVFRSGTTAMVGEPHPACLLPGCGDATISTAVERKGEAFRWTTTTRFITGSVVIVTYVDVSPYGLAVG